MEHHHKNAHPIKKMPTPPKKPAKNIPNDPKLLIIHPGFPNSIVFKKSVAPVPRHRGYKERKEVMDEGKGQNPHVYVYTIYCIMSRKIINIYYIYLKFRQLRFNIQSFDISAGSCHSK
jgi:hypothetical protein